jgi:hypothetical protein
MLLELKQPFIDGKIRVLKPKTREVILLNKMRSLLFELFINLSLKTLNYTVLLSPSILICFHQPKNFFERG